MVKIMDIFIWQTEMSEIFESHSKLDGGFFFHHAIWLKVWKYIDSVPLRFSSVKNHTSSLHCLPLVLYPLNYSLLTFSFSQCWEPHTLTAHVSSGKNLLICEPESSCSALFTMNVVWLSREVGRADTVRWVKPPGCCAKCIRAVCDLSSWVQTKLYGHLAWSVQIENRVFAACADPSQLRQQPLKSGVGPGKLDLSFNDIASRGFYLKKKEEMQSGFVWNVHQFTFLFREFIVIFNATVTRIQKYLMWLLVAGS